MGSVHGPKEGTIAEQVTTLADLKRKGLIRHIGVSNVTARSWPRQQAITPVVCVQNHYNLAHRDDDALIDEVGPAGDRVHAVLPARRVLAAAVVHAVGRGGTGWGHGRCRWRWTWLLRRSPISC